MADGLLAVWARSVVGPRSRQLKRWSGLVLTIPLEEVIVAGSVTTDLAILLTCGHTVCYDHFRTPGSHSARQLASQETPAATCLLAVELSRRSPTKCPRKTREDSPAAVTEAEGAGNGRKGCKRDSVKSGGSASKKRNATHAFVVSVYGGKLFWLHKHNTESTNIVLSKSIKKKFSAVRPWFERSLRL